MGRTSDAKDRLMQAALDLLWAESYGTVTIDDICKRADVRKGSFYYFFPGKAELAVATLEHTWATEWKPFLDQHLSLDKEPVARFRDYFSAILAKQTELAQQHGKVLGCPVFSMGNECSCSAEQAAVSTAIREVFAKKRRYYEASLRDAVAAGAIEPCDPAEKATALFGLINGLVGQARVMNDLNILKSLPQLGLDLLKVRAPALV
jgi:TetR/AcrR family transcriptional regulator, transcriptional repressor for nem operon